MRMKTLQLIALFCIELVLFLPLSFALTINTGATPVKSVNSNSATIEWLTDVPATSSVQYGETQSLGSDITLPQLETYHSVDITGLDPQKTYYFQVLSVSGQGAYAYDDNNGDFYTFFTSEQASTTPPAISNITILSKTDTTTSIKWATNENANSKIYFGRAGQPLLDHRESASFVKDHVLTIPAEKDVDYDYIISSCDEDGNCANSSKLSFTGGLDVTPPEITFDIPAFISEPRINLAGNIEPYSTIEIYLEGQISRIIPPQFTSSGFVTIYNLLFPAVENNMTITATDQVGNTNSQDYTVIVDNSPPILRVAGLPNITDSSSASATVNISEPCTVIFESGVLDTVAPGRVTGVKVEAPTATFFKISWDARAESDLDEYGVYRLADDGATWLRIAVTKETSYQDAKIIAGREYKYKISATDMKCNEGEKSDFASRTASLAASKLMPEPAEVSFTCTQRIDKVQNDGGRFTHAVSFEEGLNTVRIRAIDRAGHTAEYLHEVIYDVEQPQFVTTNLDQISPSYISTVTLRGQVSEKSGVIVYINNKVKDTIETNDDGTFSAPLELLREGTAGTATGIGAGIGAGVGGAGGSWTNKIKLVATDLVGRQSNPEEADVVLTLCGYGSWFRTDIGGQATSVFGAGGLTPPILNPRSMLDGTEIISFPLNISYVGGYSAVISNVIIRKDFVSAENEDRYDSDWVGEPTVMCVPEGAAQSKTCFVQIAVSNVPEPQPEDEDDNLTMFEKEQNISSHRLGTCLTPGVGCLRLPLLLEINFQETRAITGVTAQQFPGQQNVQSLVQKECWDVEIGIDQRVPPDVIPTELLEFMVGLFDRVINISTMLLTPLNNVKTIVFGLCSTMWIVQFIMSISATFACKSPEPSKEDSGNFLNSPAGQALGTLAGEFAGGKFNPDIARIGECDAEYGQYTKGGTWVDTSEGVSSANSNPAESYTNCKSCENAVKNKEKVEYTMRQFCDRIFCPSAPTLQKYIKDARKNPPKEVKGPTSGNKYYYGNSCGCDLSGATSSIQCVTSQSTSQGGTAQPLSYNTIKKVFEFYKKEKSRGTKSYCVGPHPAMPLCCGYEYMRQWGSSCGVGDEALFNEIEKSLCLSAQGSNQPNQLELGGDIGTITCNRNTANAGSGLCSANGSSTVEPVPTGFRVNPSAVVGSTVAPDDNQLYVCLYPNPASLSSSSTGSRYIVKFCYAATRSTIAANAQASTDGFIPLQRDFGFYTPTTGVDWDLTALFTYDENLNDEARAKKETENINQFHSKLGSKVSTGIVTTSTSGAPASGGSGATLNTETSKNLYNQIKDKIGTPDQDYIMNPTAGLGRAFMCICLTAMTSYLSLIIRVSTALRNCFQTILVTGDGSAGACQAVVSTYICDLIYELIKCASSRHSGGAGGRREAGGSSTDFLGGMTQAGNDVSDSISGRYGSSSTWKAIFVENKLMNAVCLWIFTGTWDLDFETLFEGEETNPPIASIGMLYPCKRRFKLFNPISTPEGLVNYEYEFGAALIPGAALTYTLKLKCSSGYECDASDGFLNGRCDCPDGERELIVSDSQLTGHLTTSESLDAQVFYTVQGNAQTSVRYDKATLEWTWTDADGATRKANVNCSVQEVGGAAPVFCNFDVAHGVFRCSIGLQTDNWVRLNAILPAYTPGQEYFKILEKPKFHVDVEQGIPTNNPTCSNQNCEYTKYMKMTIKNQLGGVVWSTGIAPTLSLEPKKLVTGGQNVFIYPSGTEEINIPAITSGDFAKLPGAAAEMGRTSTECIIGTAPAGALVLEDKCRDSTDKQTCAQACTTDYLTISGTPAGGTRTLVIAMDQTNYKIFETNLYTNPGAASTKGIDSNFYQSTGGISVGKTSFGGKAADVRLTGTGLNFTIYPPNKYVEIPIFIRPAPDTAAASQECSKMDEFNEAKLKPWTAEVKIYRAKQSGSSWTISDTVEAENSASFVAVCSGEQQAAVPATPAGSAAAATGKIKLVKKTSASSSNCPDIINFNQKLFISYWDGSGWVDTCAYVERNLLTFGAYFIFFPNGVSSAMSGIGFVANNQISLPSPGIGSVGGWATRATYLNSMIEACKKIHKSTMSESDFAKFTECIDNPANCDTSREYALSAPSSASDCVAEKFPQTGYSGSSTYQPTITAITSQNLVSKNLLILMPAGTQSQCGPSNYPLVFYKKANENIIRESCLYMYDGSQDQGRLSMHSDDTGVDPILGRINRADLTIGIQRFVEYWDLISDLSRLNLVLDACKFLRGAKLISAQDYNLYQAYSNTPSNIPSEGKFFELQNIGTQSAQCTQQIFANT